MNIFRLLFFCYGRIYSHRAAFIPTKKQRLPPRGMTLAEASASLVSATRLEGGNSDRYAQHHLESRPLIKGSTQLQQQQKTTIIARIMIQVQLSSKRLHKQLLFIYVPPSCHLSTLNAQYYVMPEVDLCYCYFEKSNTAAPSFITRRASKVFPFLEMNPRILAVAPVASIRITSVFGIVFLHMVIPTLNSQPEP